VHLSVDPSHKFRQRAFIWQQLSVYIFTPLFDIFHSEHVLRKIHHCTFLS